MGDLHWHHLVVRTSLNIFQCVHNACATFCPLFRCFHLEKRNDSSNTLSSECYLVGLAGTGSACVQAGHVALVVTVQFFKRVTITGVSAPLKHSSRVASATRHAKRSVQCCDIWMEKTTASSNAEAPQTRQQSQGKRQTAAYLTR